MANLFSEKVISQVKFIILRGDTKLGKGNFLQRVQRVESRAVPSAVEAERGFGDRRQVTKDCYPEKVMIFGEKSDNVALHNVTIVRLDEERLELSSERPFRVGQTIKFLQRQRATDFPDTGTIIWILECRDGYRAGVCFL